MNYKPSIFIFSVYQANQCAAVNEGEHKSVLANLKRLGLRVIELEGCYNRTVEQSILIEGLDTRSTVEELCKFYNQECYLESHSDRNVFLVFPNGTVESIGKFVPVSQSRAFQYESWSYNSSINQYFITE
jgi:hypothetical protein